MYKFSLKFCFILTFPIFLCFSQALSGGHGWQSKQIKDALTAAPHAVTHDASIYGWDPNNKGQMIVLRHGTGPHICLPSGFSSVRLGRPPLPYPDPMCLEQNAWNFMRAVLSEKNPMKPSKPYPTAPGLVWMLAGMPLSQGMLDIGENSKIEVKTTKSGVKLAKISPHIMIMPFPILEEASDIGSKYDPSDPHASWVMLAGTPLEHIMVHFSERDVQAMMNAKK